MDELAAPGLAAQGLATGGWTAIFHEWWLWAGLIAGAFYKVMRQLDTLLAPSQRESLALWLMGAVEDSWHRHFCAAFDRIFGARHLSWTRFLRSGAASILAVLFLCALFDLGVVGLTRPFVTEEPLPLVEVLVIGALINILSNYFSFWQTRFVLGTLGIAPRLWAQALVLTLDLVLSATIIYLSANIICQGVALYFWIKGEGRFAFLALSGVVSIYPVFFYSTFMISLWLWFYCASAALMRLFCRTPLHKLLDVENKPGASLGAVGAALIFVAVFGLFFLPRAAADHLRAAFMAVPP